MGKTTIEVRDETWERLKQRKNRGETYDDIVTEALDALEKNGA